MGSKLSLLAAALSSAGAFSQVTAPTIKGIHPTCEALMPSATQTVNPKFGWSLERAARFALCNNPQQRSARATSKIDDYQIENAELAYWPSVGLTLSKSNAISTGNTLTFDSSGPNTLVEVMNKVKSSASMATLQITHTLWDFGAREANLNRAKLQKMASIATAQSAEQALTAQVAQAYLAVAAAASVAHEGPFAPGEQMARAQLASLLGLDLGTYLNLEPVTTYQFEKPEEWSTWWELANTRPDLAAANAHIAADKEALKAATAALRGTIALSYSATPGYSSIVGRNNTESASLAYTVPIFNGAASTTAVDSSAARLSAHQADAESTIRAAQLDVYKAWASYKQAYQTAEQFRTVTSKESASTKDAAIMALLQARIGLLQSIGRLTPSAL